MDQEHQPNLKHSIQEEEFAALYALGALEGAELLAFRQHLASCASCQEIVDQDLETLSRLIAAAPEMEAEPGFRQRLRARADREVEGCAAGEPTSS